MQDSVRLYRAFLSVPIQAESDDEAWSSAIEYANSLTHPEHDTIVGHLELLGEVREGWAQIARVVDADPKFLSQLPHDWTP